MPRRGSEVGMLLAGVVVIAAGFGVALVKALELPSYTIPFVVGAAVLAVGLIRRLSRPEASDEPRRSPRGTRDRASPGSPDRA